MGERVVTIGGNQATRPISDFEMGNVYGKKWYVNNLKSATGNGKSWDYPFKTITEAAAAAAAGDIINIWGDGTTANQYAESVVPTVAGLKFFGAGSCPNNTIWAGLAGAAIAVNALVDTWIDNIRFRPASGYAGISLLGAASYTKITKNRFQGQTGSLQGIVSDGRQSGVIIDGNWFMYMNLLTTGCGIYVPIYGTTAEAASWTITNNDFHSNTNHIKGNLRYSTIRGNSFAAYGLLAAGGQGAPDKCIDLTPATGSVGNNMITQNTFGGSYSTALYVSADANECWIGNFAYHVTYAPNGLSIAVPGA